MWSFGTIFDAVLRQNIGYHSGFSLSRQEKREILTRFYPKKAQLPSFVPCQNTTQYRLCGIKKEEKNVKTESQKNKKARASILAALLAIALLLTGTFAWRSMSQKAINEYVDARNPGGRVHDDFNGLKNKDIYVENFTDVEDGAPVFARVKLLEYMEIGTDAGMKRDDPNRKATSLVPGAYINQHDTWQVYIPGAENDKFREYWDWTMGGQTTYLPTFNKNKDSLSVDVNGTYVGPNGEFDDIDPYKDYQEYEAGTAYPGTEYYDADDNDDDEYIKDGVGGPDGNGGVLDTNYSIKADVEHVALKTLNGQGIISMADWKAAGSPICNKWVYDTDGWFYWPEPILPQTATGLLLDKVDQRKSAGERSYYAIEVVGQFSNGAGGTEDDKWGDSSIDDDTDPNKGFYADGFSEDAKALLDQAASVIFGKEDGKWYLPEPENNNLYKQVKDDDGKISGLISAGLDGVIGTADDRADVVTHTADIVIAGKNYGKYYLPATETEPFYRVNGDDGKLGTKTDTCFWLTGSTFPSEDVTTEPVTSVTVTAADDATEVKNDTPLTFTAEVVTANAALTNKDVTWSVSGNENAETTISDIGVLTVKGEAVDTELTVTATSKLDSRKSGSATVKVVAEP